MSAPSGPRTLNGKVVLTVYLLDNSYKTILCEPTSTVHDVCRQMADKIGFSDPEDDSLCFSLNECLDGITIARPLPGDKEVLTIMEGWYGKPDAKFIFQCKLYTDGMINSKDPKVIQMLFIQGIYNIISGTYPTSEREAVALAALQFQARFGSHNPATHKPGFLTSTLVEYLPAVHIESGGKTAAQWEEMIFHKHAFSTSTNPRESYLGLLAKRDYYGAALFAVKQKFDRSMPRKLYIAISRRGILLVRIPNNAADEDGMETLQSYPLADIYRWAYKPGVNFYFEIKGEGGNSRNGDEDNNKVYTFETPEGKNMSDLLTDYALALLREMGLNPDGSKRVRPPKPMPKVAQATSSSSSSSSSAAASTGAAAAPAVSSSPSAGAGSAAAAPVVLPTRSAMAANTEAYKGASGDAATLAVAALRSGEYQDSSAAAAPAPAAAGGAPPPPSFSAPPPPPPPPASALPPPPPPAPSGKPELPPNWIECVDDESGDVYYFNQVTGDSVWELEDIPRP